MTKCNPGGKHEMLKLFMIVVALSCALLVTFVIYLKNIIKQEADPFLSVYSRNMDYIAKVYRIDSDKMEGSSISVSVFDSKNRILREDIYRQWYCVNVSISWKNDDELIINGIQLNRKFDAIEFVTQPTDFCPEYSTIY